MCNLASIALPRFVRERGAEPAREGKKLVGSLDAPNRCAGELNRAAQTIGGGQGMCIQTKLDVVMDHISKFQRLLR